MELTNKELTEGLNLKLTKVRRWTRAFLPPDKEATRRSGYTRKFSVDQAWEIYFGGHILVEQHAYSILESKTIISDLRKWMKSVRLYPSVHDRSVKFLSEERSLGDSELQFPLGDNELHFSSIGIDILRKWSDRDSFVYLAKHVLECSTDQKTRITTERYILKRPGGEFNGRTIDKKSIQISHHFQDFCTKLDT
jgi:hypothetical protein